LTTTKERLPLKQGLLLVNLGSPASPSKTDVRHYLNQFLMDKHVITLPWVLRRLLVSLILATRPASSARAYESIWWPEGSPLVVLGRQLTDAVGSLWQQGPTVLAMRYGEPSLQDALRQLALQGVRHVVLAPLYPQFAHSTTTTVIEEAHRVIRQDGLAITLDVLPAFYDTPAYIDALVASAQPYLSEAFDHLLLSFHGLPEKHIHQSVVGPNVCLKSIDCCQCAAQSTLAHCYRAQCIHTANALAAQLKLKTQQWSFSFQSRLGRTKWIEPYTDQQLCDLANSGVKKLLVMCPGFVADCLETLEEIGERGRECFINAGGESFTLIPCLNTHPVWVKGLTLLCEHVLEKTSPGVQCKK
jgi:ferrochelatase